MESQFRRPTVSFLEKQYSLSSYIFLVLQETIGPLFALQTTDIRGDIRSLFQVTKLACLVGMERSQDVPQQ